jgi:hypothetical protein
MPVPDASLGTWFLQSAKRTGDRRAPAGESAREQVS